MKVLRVWRLQVGHMRTYIVQATLHIPEIALLEAGFFRGQWVRRSDDVDAVSLRSANVPLRNGIRRQMSDLLKSGDHTVCCSILRGGIL